MSSAPLRMSCTVIVDPFGSGIVIVGGKRSTRDVGSDRNTWYLDAVLGPFHVTPTSGGVPFWNTASSPVGGSTFDGAPWLQSGCVHCVANSSASCSVMTPSRSRSRGSDGLSAGWFCDDTTM